MKPSQKIQRTIQSRSGQHHQSGDGNTCRLHLLDMVADQIIRTPTICSTSLSVVNPFAAIQRNPNVNVVLSKKLQIIRGQDGPIGLHGKGPADLRCSPLDCPDPAVILVGLQQHGLSAVENHMNFGFSFALGIAGSPLQGGQHSLIGHALRFYFFSDRAVVTA